MTSIRSALRRTAKLLTVRPYHAIRSSRAVSFVLLNRRAREAYAALPPIGSPVAERLSHELTLHGIARTTLDELFPGAGLLPRLKDAAARALAGATVGDKKTFLRYAWAERPTLTMADPFVALSLDDRTLAVVNGYMRLAGRFDYFGLMESLVMPRGAEPTRSQCWHRDPEDTVMCKMFVYLNDVDEGAGPFVYARGSQQGGRWRSVFPQERPYGSYPAAEAVASRIPKDDIRTCAGPAGTVLFADTTGLHRGGYCSDASRIMFTASFSTDASLSPGRLYTVPDGFPVEGLSPAARAALRL